MPLEEGQMKTQGVDVIVAARPMTLYSLRYVRSTSIQIIAIDASEKYES